MIPELSYYPARFIMYDSERNIDLWTFRSKKSQKRYIVEIEKFPNLLFGIKFFWKGVASSPDRYSLLTGDYEPRRIVMSCIMIMFDYYKRFPLASFGFVAAEDTNSPKSADSPNKRFRLYRRMMLSTFGEKSFLQAQDYLHAIYLLINRKAVEEGRISIELIEKELSTIYYGEYNVTIES